MECFCAFLRGVNTGGRKMIMSEVCDAVKSSEVSNVSSVLATGNIIFTSAESKDKLKKILMDSLSGYYGEEVNLFIKSKNEIESYITSVPFEENPELHIYAFICKEGFEETLLDEFSKITPSEDEKAKISNGLFYWQCRKGSTLDSGFSKILGRKNMRDMFTSRNISTLKKISAKLR